MRLRPILFFYLIVLSILLGNEIAMGSCISFPRDAEDPTVQVCEELDQFTFRIANITRSYPRDEFIARVAKATYTWLSEHGKAAAITPNSSFQVWMTVPVANPDAAQPRVILSTSQGWISFWLDLDASDWLFRDNEAALIVNDPYPRNFGYRPASIIVQAQQHSLARDVEETLYNQGATSVINRGNGLFEAGCSLFEERTLASRASAENSVIKYAQVNSVMEWIADRQMAFSIPVSSLDQESIEP